MPGTILGVRDRMENRTKFFACIVLDILMVATEKVTK